MSLIIAVLIAAVAIATAGLFRLAYWLSQIQAELSGIRVGMFKMVEAIEKNAGHVERLPERLERIEDALTAIDGSLESKEAVDDAL